MVRPPGQPPPPPPPWQPPADKPRFPVDISDLPMEDNTMNHGVIWTIVGVLAVIALLIFIIPRLT